MEERKFDLLIYGATGFTGQQIVKYLASEDYKELKWAIGGRNQSKLKNLKKTLEEINPSCSEVGILVGDVQDQKSIDDCVAQAKVVLSAAGPFGEVGTPLVDACVRLNSHYCDTTGEISWVKKMITKYDEDARKKDVKIVHQCAFDSVPSDIGALLAVTHIRNRGKQIGDVQAFITELNIAFSGGTVSSFASIFKNTPYSELSRMFSQSYLNSEQLPGKDGKDLNFLTYNHTINNWISISFLALPNTRAVRRSAGLLNYGQNFRYNEYLSLPGFWKNLKNAIQVNLINLLMITAPLRWLTLKLMPPPGQGPSEEQMNHGSFSMDIIAQSVKENDNDEPIQVKVKISDSTDIGYRDTAKIAAQMALCLLNNEADEHCLKGGVLTPASAIGLACLPRLRKIKTLKIEALNDN